MIKWMKVICIVGTRYFNFDYTYYLVISSIGFQCLTLVWIKYQFDRAVFYVNQIVIRQENGSLKRSPSSIIQTENPKYGGDASIHEEKYSILLKKVPTICFYTI